MHQTKKAWHCCCRLWLQNNWTLPAILNPPTVRNGSDMQPNVRRETQCFFSGIQCSIEKCNRIWNLTFRVSGIFVQHMIRQIDKSYILAIRHGQLDYFYQWSVFSLTWDMILVSSIVAARQYLSVWGDRSKQQACPSCLSQQQQQCKHNLGFYFSHGVSYHFKETVG